MSIVQFDSDELVEILRDRGFAVAIIDPGWMGPSINPRRVEEIMEERGCAYVNENRVTSFDDVPKTFPGKYDDWREEEDGGYCV